LLPPLITEIAIVVLAAFLGGLTAHRFKIPLVVGYLVVGLVFGSVYSEKIQSREFINFFSEIGIALLLFTLGLEFSLDRLKVVGRPAITAGVVQILFTAILGLLFIPAILNIDYKEALFLGFAVSLSSTAVVVKILYDRGEIDTPYGELQVGWLIAQDLAVLPLMVFLPLLSDRGVGETDGIWGIIVPVFKSGLLLYLTLVLGRKIIPILFKKLALFNNRELLLLASFAFAIIFSALTNELGMSFALGAFLAGLILSTASVNHEVFAEVRPIRDLFASIFFVSIGFLVSISFLIKNIIPILLLTLFVIFFKFAIVFFVSLFLKYHTKTAFLTGVGLFQIGEFSFILASMGRSEGILEDRLVSILTASAILTLIISPFASLRAPLFYKKIFTFLKIKYPKFYNKFFKSKDMRVSFPTREELKGHVLVIGFGRVGRQICHILDIANTSYVVIDQNLKSLDYLKRQGKPYVYGDAIEGEILELAGIKNAKAVVVAIGDVTDSELILNHSLRLNPKAKFVARAHKDIDAARLKIRGVASVIQPEFEASISLARAALYAHDALDIKDIESYLARARKEYRYF